MAITYPVTFPEIDGKTIIQNMSMRLIHSVSMTESPVNYKQLVATHSAAKWEAEVTIRPLSHDEAKTFSAFLASLRGMEKTFTMGDPLMAYSSTPDMQTGASDTVGSTHLNIDNNSSQNIKAGSHFEVGGRLYMLLEDSNAGTQGNKDISPALQTNVSIYTQLTFNEPKATWRLATNDIDWDINTSRFYNFTFACVSVV